MPTRINGIGTAYVGKKNREEFQAVCEHCSKATMLSSYDTRLWFTFLFVPLIPLRRKRILDLCPLCTWHRAVKMDDWEQLTREAVESSAEQLAEKQDDPQAAINMHGTLVGCGRRAEAEKLAAIMEKKFPNDFDTHLYLGVWYASIGKSPQDDACFARALEIDPDNPAARRAVGVARIEQGKLEEARELFAPLEPPSVHYDPQLFFLLALAHQGREDHAKAMELFRLVAEASPEAAGENAFRKAVRKSEREMGVETPLVPSVRFYHRKPVRWAAVGLAALLAFAGYAWYLGQNRVLHVVNGLNVPITVKLDGEQTIDVAGRAFVTTSVAEGSHRAVVTSPQGFDDPVAFVLSTGWTGRLFNKPVFVLDPGRTATVMWDDAKYSETPDPNHQNNMRLHVGEEFNYFPDIDYIFEEFPEQIKVERGRDVVKTRVTLLEIDPASTLMLFPDALSGDARLAFLERHLNLTADSKPLLETYGEIARQLDELDRCHDFLASKLDARPIAVEWHRAYQDLCETTGRDADLPARYDALLADKPDDSVAWYLRARVEPDGRKVEEMTDRSLALDDNNAYAWMSRVSLKTAQADFSAAKQAASRALTLMPDNDDLRQQLYRIRLANGELAELEEELTTLLAQEPFNVPAHITLITVLVAAGKPDEAQKTQQTLAETVKGLLPGDPRQFALQTELVYLYSKGDFEQLAERYKRANDKSTAAQFGFEALVLLDRIDEASTLVDSFPDDSQGFARLLLSTAWKQTGDAQRAESVGRQAIEGMANGSLTEQKTAEFLRQDSIQFDDIDRLNLVPARQMCLVAYLLANGRGDGGPLIERARALAAMRTFPCHLVTQTVEWAGEQPPDGPDEEPAETPQETTTR